MADKLDIFNKNLEKYKDEAQLTYQQIADRAKISRGYLNELKGKKRNRRLNIDVLTRIAAVFNKNASDMLNNNDEIKNNKETCLPNKIETISSSHLHISQTNAVLIARDVLEKHGNTPQNEKINELASLMCEAASKIDTDCINSSLAEWLIEVIKNKNPQ